MSSTILSYTIPMKYPIIQIWDPILRKKTQDINLQNISDYQEVFDSMIETLTHEGWVGLAAPQIWISESFFLLHIAPTKTRPHLSNMWPQIIINPKIVKYSDNIVYGWEWCLSIGWITPIQWLKWKVPRSEWITVEYTTRKWEKVQKKLSWFEAIVFQHEYDHLQWIFFLDRMDNMSSIMNHELYIEMKKKDL